MPLYEYEHKPTGDRLVVNSSDKPMMDNLVRADPHLWRRIFSFSTASTYSAVNPLDPRHPPVTSRTRHRDMLKALSEQESARHGGMDVDFQPVDISDPSAVGVSEQGIETHKRRQWERKNA